MISRHFQGQHWPRESYSPTSFSLQERVMIGLICFVAFVVVAYLFGMLVLIWRT